MPGQFVHSACMHLNHIKRDYSQPDIQDSTTERHAGSARTRRIANGNKRGERKGEGEEVLFATSSIGPLQSKTLKSSATESVIDLKRRTEFQCC